MGPETPRPEVARRLRRLADLIGEGLPDTIDLKPIPHGYDAVSALLLARMAAQTKSIAALIELGHDLDARMIMRSLVEHLIVLSWLSISVSEYQRDTGVYGGRWHASEPDETTRWWAARQLRRDQLRIESQAKNLGLLPDEEIRKTIRALKPMLTKVDRGELPSLDELAAEADRCWGGRLPGWPAEAPTEPGGIFSLRGIHHTLYQLGNAATHPDLSALHALIEPTDTAGQHQFIRARSGASVETSVAMAAYVVLYAIGAYHHRHGLPDLDAALQVLDRFDDVRGPGLLINTAMSILGPGTRYAVTDSGEHLSVVTDGSDLMIGRANTEGWMLLRYSPGPGWRVTDHHEPSAERSLTRMDLHGDVTAKMVGLRAQLVSVAPETWSDSPPPGFCGELEARLG